MKSEEEDPFADASISFTVGEVAKVFFNVSPSWIRWRERGGFIRDAGGDPIGSRGDAKVKANGKVAGNRLYGLEDIDQMADALASSGLISVMSRDLVRARVKLYRKLETCRRTVYEQLRKLQDEQVETLRAPNERTSR